MRTNLFSHLLFAIIIVANFLQTASIHSILLSFFCQHDRGVSSKDSGQIIIDLPTDVFLHLQINVIEKTIVANYATDACTYIDFCLSHKLPLNPTTETLSCYVVSIYRSIAWAPKYFWSLQVYSELSQTSHPNSLLLKPPLLPSVYQFAPCMSQISRLTQHQLLFGHLVYIPVPVWSVVVSLTA